VKGGFPDLKHEEGLIRHGGGRGMKIKPIVFNLTPEETLRLTRILLDEDQEEALLFLRECLKPQLEAATRDH
jgi:hypothetical protein